MYCPFKAAVGEDAHTHTHLSSKDPTNSDDAEDIKDGRADDRSDSNITVSDEDTWKQTQWAKVLHKKEQEQRLCDFTYNRSEEFGRWAPRRHERGSSHILAQIQLLHNTTTADDSHPAKPLAQTPPKSGAVCFMKASKWVRGRIVQTLLLSLCRGITQINWEFTSEQSYLTDFLKRHHEEVVAHDRQGQEHVEGL